MANGLLIPSGIPASEDSINVSYGAGFFPAASIDPDPIRINNITLECSNYIATFNGNITSTNNPNSQVSLFSSNELVFYTGWFGVFLPTQIRIDVACSGLSDSYWNTQANTQHPSITLSRAQLLSSNGDTVSGNLRSSIGTTDKASIQAAVYVYFAIDTELTASGIKVHLKYDRHDVGASSGRGSGTASYSANFKVTYTIEP